MIKYSDIIKCFDSNEWDFSYLTFSEMQEVLNHPIKLINRIEEIKLYKTDFQEQSICLIVVKHTYDFDYTLNKFFIETLNEYYSNLNYRVFECNYKYAAVKSGLGQYAKNSLFYHSKFQFDSHIAVFLFPEGIDDLPNRKPANFHLLKSCENCEDCIKACPVSAININDQSRTWIDLIKCDNFCHFGNHGKIPSIKWNLVKINNLNLSQEEIYNIQNFQDWIQTVGPGGEFLNINGNNSYVVFPICRECTSQKKCSKYGGKYPYDWNRILIFNKEKKEEGGKYHHGNII